MNDSSLFDFINNSTELPVYSPAPVLGAALYPSHFSYQQEEEIPPELWQTLVFGLSLATCAGFSAPIGITIVPLLPKEIYERIMIYLVALGIGAMSSSCLFILIPQAFQITTLHSFKYTHKCWLILSAIYIFFTIDRCLQFYVALKRRKNKRRVHIKAIASILNPFGSDKKNKSHHQHEEKVDVRRKSILKKTTNNTTIQKQPEPPKTTPPSVTVIDVDKDHDTSSATVTTNADDISLTSSCRQISKNSNVIDLKKDTYSRDNSHNSDSDDDSTSRFDLSQEKNTIQYDLKVATMGNAFVRTLSQRRRVGIIRESQNQLDEIRFNGVDNKTLKCTKSMPLPYDQNRSYSNHKSIDVTVDVVEKKVLNTESLEISTVVYMMLLGGAANNFVDGMSTGAAFSDSIKKGFSIGLAVFSQQLPQELGTLAIMINSGLGLKKTLVFNLIPISMGYFGFITGVILDNINDTFDDEVFAISAGMYCYIFLGTLLPELRDSFNEILQKDLIEASLVNVLQYIGICSGIALMYFISIYGDR